MSHNWPESDRLVPDGDISSKVYGQPNNIQGRKGRSTDKGVTKLWVVHDFFIHGEVIFRRHMSNQGWRVSSVYLSTGEAGGYTSSWITSIMSADTLTAPSSFLSLWRVDGPIEVPAVQQVHGLAESTYVYQGSSGGLDFPLEAESM